MDINKSYLVGIIISLIIIIPSLFFTESKFFLFSIGMGLLILAFPFLFALILNSQISAEKEQMFIEFSRNLVESVKTGTPISKSITNVKVNSYGALSKNIEKLVNQISLGIPLSFALKTFSDDVNNRTISRALTLIGQAEKAGGDIGEILESVAGATSMTDKLKKERKAAISTLVVQGYIIFIIFLLIVLIMQFKILPMMSGISNLEGEGIEQFGLGEALTQQEMARPFLYMLLIQGFFSGLAIGKLSEGTIKQGLKHSFSLMLLAFLVTSISSIFL
jgi:archaeal flagellar protein FlaJ